MTTTITTLFVVFKPHVFVVSSNYIYLIHYCSFVLVRDGEFKESELVDALNAPGRVDVPGASGTRNLHDNLSDLRAQVAANQKVFG